MTPLGPIVSLVPSRRQSSLASIQDADVFGYRPRLDKVV